MPKPFTQTNHHERKNQNVHIFASPHTNDSHDPQDSTGEKSHTADIQSVFGQAAGKKFRGITPSIGSK